MEKRNVLFKRWIQKQWSGEAYPNNIIVGTNQWDDDFIHPGKFHCWGANYEEFESGAGNFSVGIVELPDGRIAEVLPSNIKFVD